MSNQTAIQTSHNFQDILKDVKIQERFNALLAADAAEFMASLVSLVDADEKLLACKPNTLLVAATLAAILKLPIIPDLGQAFIIPYKGEAKMIVGYRGFLQLADRTHEYKYINATEVYQGEEIIEDRQSGAIKMRGKQISEEVIGYLSFFRLLSGREQSIYFTKEKMTRYAIKYAPSWGNNKSPWTTHFDEMGKKVVLKRAIWKYGPMSISQRLAYSSDMDSDQSLTVPRFDDVDLDKYIDAKLKDPVKFDAAEKPEEKEPGQAPTPHQDAPGQPAAKEGPQVITPPVQRPYSPTVLKEKLEERAKGYTGKATKNQTELLVILMDKAFGDAGDNTQMRHMATKTIFGVESLNDLPDGLKLAMINDWLNTVRDTDKNYDMACRELNQAYLIAAKAAQGAEAEAASPEAGQLSLPDL